MSGEAASAPLPERRRRRRWPWVAGITIVVLLAAFYGGGGFYFSNVLDERALDGASMRAATAELDPDVEVLTVATADVPGETTITLRAIDGDLGVALQGVQGLRWESGYGRIVPIGPGDGSEDSSRVERAFTLIDGTLPTSGTRAELDVRAYPMEPADSGLGLQALTVSGPLGDYPAWLGSSAGPTWAIVVHGNSLSPADGLRIVPILTQAGFPTLVATYRNDPETPEDPSGKLRYGLTEWEDLEAMVRYALEQGSDGVVLDGYSMGGGVVAAFLQRSRLSAEVRAVIFDAPMLDFSTTVDDNAARETLPVVGLPLPSSLTAVAKWMAGARFDVEWSSLDYLADTSRYDVPFLVFHGTADTTVPIGTSREFARLLPEAVTLVECEGAEHIGCWNLGPDRYATVVRAFLDEATR
ncbi:MAG: lysophospholipase [Actinomycetota bacterium]|nr:lysophospholipase [Actinomycetota bacterium]MDH5223922.1 lysophospholipase [Actinomycetota bacterium]MDH5313131.1 lysophospholipase [Actinomycetota bacterium]